MCPIISVRACSVLQCYYQGLKTFVSLARTELLLGLMESHTAYMDWLDILGLDPLSHLEVKIQLGSLDRMASSGLAALNSNGDARGLFQPVCQV